MRRKNLWLRLSSCTMAALLATTSVTPTFGADFASEVVVESQQEETTAEEEGSQVEVGDDFQDEDIANVATDETEVEAESDSEEAAVFSDEENAEEEVFSDEAGEEAAATFEFGTARTKLEKGSYTVKVSLMNASNPANASMAGSCIAGDATMVVAEDGNAKVTVPVQAVSVYGMTGNASQWKVYKSDLKSDKTDAEFTTDADGKVNSITYTIPDKTTDGAYVNMYVDMMSTTVDAFLKLDYANAVKQAPAVDTTALEATIAKADALDEMSYTKASWDGNKDAIETAKTAANAALEAKESQEAVDNANTALTEAMAKLAEAGDPAELQAAVDQAKAMKQEDYTYKSVNNWWKGLQTAIANAETAIEGRETAANLTKSKNSLDTYVGRLVKAYDTTALTAKIAEAESLKEEDYTADSWKAANLRKVLDIAKYVIETRGSKDEVKCAINDLETAMEKLVAVSVEVTVGRGDFQKKLTPGTYSLPIDLLNAGHIESTNEYTSKDYMKHTSMASGCFTGDATLVIHEDGSATLTTGLGAVSSDALGTAQSGGADDWSIYESTQDFLDGKANSVRGARFKARIDKQGVLAGKRKPTKISFTVPDLKQNVVATRMHIEIMGVYQDACIGLDWTNVKKVSDETSATSTVEKTYDVAPDVQTQLVNMKAGTTVKLDQDVTLAEDLVIKGGTLDLNGHVLNQADNLIRIKGDVTIVDTSAEKTGKITREKYVSNTYSSASITVEKGSLTAEGITIDGQLGNEMSYNSKNHLTGLPHVSVSLKNCTVTNSLPFSSYNTNTACIYFEDYANGLDLTVDGCTFNKTFVVSGCTGEKVFVTNSTLWSYQQSASTGGTTVFTGNKVSTSVHINTDKLTIKDDTIGSGLNINVTSDTVLENLDVTVDSRSGAAVTTGGVGTVTIKSGVYSNTAKRGHAFEAEGTPIVIEGGYFKSLGTVASDAKYRTPANKKLGEVTEGDYAGYYTIVDDTEGTVADPVATIYNADGTEAEKLGEDKADMITSFAGEGQTVKLNKDISTSYETNYKNMTLDLNGHTLTLQALVAYHGTCHVIDSSADKSGKIVASLAIFHSMENFDSGLILDGVTCESPRLQYASIGKLYVINGTKINGVTTINPLMGSGAVYIQDSTWTFGEGADGQALLEETVRTAQYAITKNADGSFTMAVTDFGKAMRAFEALDESAYTKASYKAAKDLYDELDVTVDEEITEEQTKGFQDAVAALQVAASESDIIALNDVITAARALNASDYTAASYKTLSDAVAAAEVLAGSDDLAQADVTAAVQAINDATAALVKLSAQKITVTSRYSKKLGDKAFSLNAKAKGKLTYKSSNTKVATVDSKGKVTLKGVGSATITVSATATGDYKAASAKVTVKVAKGTPTIKVKTTSKTLKVATVKKKAQKIALKASVNSKGKLSFKKASGNKAITVNTRTGALTVKKGLKKGTYKVKIQITSKATKSYNAGKKTVTVTVRIK